MLNQQYLRRDTLLYPTKIQLKPAQLLHTNQHTVPSCALGTNDLKRALASKSSHKELSIHLAYRNDTWSEFNFLHYTPLLPDEALYIWTEKISVWAQPRQHENRAFVLNQ